MSWWSLRRSRSFPVSPPRLVAELVRTGGHDRTHNDNSKRGTKNGEVSGRKKWSRSTLGARER
jgi:hypothetical protein